MKLLVIRHAIAEDPLAFASTGQDDALRPLTKKGRERMRQVVTGLKRLVEPLDFCAASPLTRAVQTAEMLDAAYPGLSHTLAPVLAPDVGPRAATAWLAEQQRQNALETLAIIGHEPDLSILVAWLTCAHSAPYLRLKKGGACLLECPETLSEGQCHLLWALNPKQLRWLGGADT